MAEVTLGWLGGQIHGKVSKKSGMYYRTDKKTGKTYIVHRDNTTKMKSTENQVIARQKFALISKACTAFVKEGREAVEKREPSTLAEAFLSVSAAFNMQKDITFLRSYVMKFHAILLDDGKVEIRVDDFVKTY